MTISPHYQREFRQRQVEKGRKQVSVYLSAPALDWLDANYPKKRAEGIEELIAWASGPLETSTASDTGP